MTKRSTGLQVRKWSALVILGLALVILIIDTTLLNVSLKAIIVDLDTTIENMQWVITIYSLILGGFTITGGRLGDLYGRKRMFILGALLFAGGSFLASISGSVKEILIGESIIEGIGAALMLPATASLLIANYRGRDRAIAFGVWGGLAAASSAIGPILGGWLTTHYSWRWGFRINIVVVLILIIGSVLIKDNSAELRKKMKNVTLDFVGILLSAIGLLSVVFAFLETSKYGWFVAKAPLIIRDHVFNLGPLSVTPLFLIFGLVVLWLFVLWERRRGRQGKTQLLSLSLFRNQQFITGTVVTAILFLAQSGMIFAVPVFLQAVKHFDSFHTGLALLPLSAMLLVAAPLSAVLSRFIPPKRLVQSGLLLTIAGALVVRSSLDITTTITDLAPGFMLFGAGVGFIMAQVSNMTLSAVSVSEAGEASGINNTLRQIGSTLGSAIIGSVLLTSLTGNVIAGISHSNALSEKNKTELTSMVKSNDTDIEFNAVNQLPTNTPQEVKNEFSTIIDDSTVDANRTSLAFSAGFLLLALLASHFLTNGSEEELTASEEKASAIA